MFVAVSRQGAVTSIALDRPDKLNAIDAALRTDLQGALELAAADETCRAVILTGRGSGFSAGQDLVEIEDDADLGQLLQTGYAPLITLIRTMPKPVLCAVRGVAAGAAANLALSCDIVLAAESARFIQAFIRIGLLPDVGGTWLLPRLIGAARARAVAMLGTPIDGRQAAEWGMIYRAVPDERLELETGALAATLAALPTHAIALMKQAFLAADSNTLDQQLAVENTLQAELGHSPDFREGRRAFLAKRSPQFTGKAR